MIGLLSELGFLLLALMNICFYWKINNLEKTIEVLQTGFIQCRSNNRTTIDMIVDRISKQN